MNLTGEIKFFLGKNDYAHLKFSETKTSLSIDIVMVPFKHRGTGVGTSLLQRIIVMADGMEKDIYTSARPIGAFSDERLEQLVQFYQQFDFHVYDRGLTVAYMKRIALTNQE